MAGISNRLGYVNPAESLRQGVAGNGLSFPTAASASPKLLPDGGMPGQQQGGPRTQHFEQGASEARPGGTLPEAAGGEAAGGAAAGGEAAAGAGIAEELAPLALAAL